LKKEVTTEKASIAASRVGKSKGGAKKKGTRAKGGLMYAVVGGKIKSVAISSRRHGPRNKTSLEKRTIGQKAVNRKSGIKKGDREKAGQAEKKKKTGREPLFE